MSESLNELKKIISVFLGIDSRNIRNDTVIDNSILQGSIKIHMMYSELADSGYKVLDYSKIRTFGELLSRLQLSNETNNKNKKEPSLNFANKNGDGFNKSNSNDNKLIINITGVGVDILQISKLPRVADFRESKFYTDNFSLREFSYCLLKADPYKSFAGKFAAKEAIVKANSDFKDVKFNEIEILNDKSGKPKFNNFSISISHEDDYAIAIASNIENYYNENKIVVKDEENQNHFRKIEQMIANVNYNLNSNYLKKSYKGLIISLSILNILTIIYIAYKVYLL